MKIRPLHKAKTAKQDEFYTQLADIEKELMHYKRHFKNKVVLCNCDDPRVSNFFHYFAYNFEALGLKKLITTCYKNQDIDLFSDHNCEQAVYLEYYGDKNGNRVPDLDEIGVKPLQGDGDFRSAECIELLKQSDIVVTNPPFSLFREYIAQLINYDKKFLIVGNQNAITYKEIFPLIKDGRIWLGPSISSGGREFEVPDNYKIRSQSACRINEKGNRFLSVAGVRWFTNMDFPKRYEDLILYEKYSPEKYPTYDNYDAIEVGKTKEIPLDYSGVMGVPITFLIKYNPNQFDIMGITQSWSDGITKTYTQQTQVGADGSRSRVTSLNGGPALKLDSAPHGKTHYIVDNNYYVKLYARILIRRHP